MNIATDRAGPVTTGLIFENRLLARFDSYYEEARLTGLFPGNPNRNPAYILFGLRGELVELTDILSHEDEYGEDIFNPEIGDICWYLAHLPYQFDYSMFTLLNNPLVYPVDYPIWATPEEAATLAGTVFPTPSENLTINSQFWLMIANFSNQIKKISRGDYANTEVKLDLEFETTLRGFVGNILSLLVQTHAQLCKTNRITTTEHIGPDNFYNWLDAILEANITKLKSRQARDTLQGDGDNR